MTKAQVDLLIIADKGSYENVAFNTSLSELTLDSQIMTLQNLHTYFKRQERGITSSVEKANVDLTQAGKLNGIILYNYCRKHDLTVELLNSLEVKALEEFSNNPPRCVALSTTWLMSKREVLPIVKLIKSYLPDVFLVIGGPLILNSKIICEQPGGVYATEEIVNDYFFLADNDHEEFKDIDLFVIEQQGEKELVDICYKLKNSQDPRDTKNCAFYRSNQLYFTKQKEEIVPFGTNIIEWDKIPEHLVPEIVPIRLSTGCPFKCKFCNFVHRKRILRKPEEVIQQEIRSLVKLKKIKFFRVVDDTLSSKELDTFCRILMQEQSEIPWTTFARADSIKPGIPRLLHNANCASVQIGIESCDDGILKAMNKKANTTLYRNVISMLGDAGVSTRATLLMGFPSETDETIENTINFLNELKYDGTATFEFSFAQFFFLPLSPIFDPDERKKYELDGYMAKWHHKTMTSDDIRKHMINAFLSIKDHIFFIYVQDDIKSSIPSKTVKKIKTLRQKARRIQLLSEISAKPLGKDFDHLINEIKGYYIPYL